MFILYTLYIYVHTKAFLPCLIKAWERTTTKKEMEDLLLLSSLFHFFYFIFSAPISFSLFSNSPSLLFLFDVLYQGFIKCVRKAFAYIYIYTYIYIYIVCTIYICFRKLINFCLTKIFMTFWFHLFGMNRMLDL